jgi:hypothetical protein
MKEYQFREGDTDPIDITLYNGTTAAVITGYTSVAIFLRSEDGAAEVEGVTPASGVTVVDAAAGTIRFHPSAATGTMTYAKNRYFGYVLVIDGTGKRATFPTFMIQMLERFAGDG